MEGLTPIWVLIIATAAWLTFVAAIMWLGRKLPEWVKSMIE